MDVLSSLDDVTLHPCEAQRMRTPNLHEKKIRKWTRIRILVGRSFSKRKDFIPICLTIT